MLKMRLIFRSGAGWLLVVDVDDSIDESAGPLKRPLDRHEGKRTHIWSWYVESRNDLCKMFDSIVDNKNLIGETRQIGQIVYATLELLNDWKTEIRWQCVPRRARLGWSLVYLSKYRPS